MSASGKYSVEEKDGVLRFVFRPPFGFRQVLGICLYVLIVCAYYAPPVRHVFKNDRAHHIEDFVLVGIFLVFGILRTFGSREVIQISRERLKTISYLLVPISWESFELNKVSNVRYRAPKRSSGYGDLVFDFEFMLRSVEIWQDEVGSAEVIREITQRFPQLAARAFGSSGTSS